MRFSWVIFYLFISPLISFAQNGVVTGTVTNIESKKPLAGASVFLSNSSVGSATNDGGKFTLYSVRPGQYTLVVTVIGYEGYSKTILVGPEPIKLKIELAQKPLMLREVVISSNADWKKNFEAFKKEFIGTDENAKSCVVLNPHILNITYNPTKQILHADGDRFLVVENKALGYRVKFLLNDFKIDKISNVISREGQQLFEDLPGSEAQKKKWHLKREDAYYGSAMHFYRSLYTDRLLQEGFTIYRFTRYLNPQRPPDEIIRKKVRIFNELRRSDSVKWYIDLANMSKYYHENLMKPPLNTWEVLTATGQPGLYSMHFLNFLYIVYTKKTDDVYNKDLFRPMDMPNYEVSVATATGPYILFDKNGVVVDNAPLYEGTWSRSRLSDMLPVDYVPDHN